MRTLYVAPDSPQRPPSPPQKPPVVQQPPVQPPPMQPPPMQQPLPMMNQVIGIPWSTGLFDCQEHQINAVMTAFVPCVTFGQIAEILDGGETSCIMGSLMYILLAPALCSCWIISNSYRKRLRNRYNLVEAPAEDWTVHLFCPCCSLCQEFRELKNRGIDPSLGWKGNLAKQQHSPTAPPQPQFMNM